MSDAIREAFEALDKLAEIADDHPGMFRGVPELRDTIKAGLDDALREYVGANKAALSANGGEAVAVADIDVDAEYRDFCEWLSGNMAFDVDYRLHTSSGNKPSVGGYIRDENARLMFAAWKEKAKRHTHPAPPSVAVPEGWKLVPIEPTEEMRAAGSAERERSPTNQNPYHTWAAMLTATPQPDHSPDAGKVVQGEPVADKVEWIKGFPPCDGDGGICHIPLKGYPDFMAIAFNNEGSLVDGCGDDIGCELDDVERWRPLNASALALTHQVTGARDMLREAAKQFRANNDIGHAAMCENHADEIDRLRARHQEGNTAGDDGEGE